MKDVGDIESVARKFADTEFTDPDRLQCLNFQITAVTDTLTRMSNWITEFNRYAEDDTVRLDTAQVARDVDQADEIISIRHCRSSA